MSNRIKELRKKANLSQRELAEKVGVAPSQIMYYERGERSPRNSETWKRLADVFGVTVPYVMGLSYYMDDSLFPKKEPFNLDIDYSEDDLLSDIYTLPELESLYERLLIIDKNEEIEATKVVKAYIDMLKTGKQALDEDERFKKDVIDAREKALTAKAHLLTRIAQMYLLMDDDDQNRLLDYAVLLTSNRKQKLSIVDDRPIEQLPLVLQVLKGAKEKVEMNLNIVFKKDKKGNVTFD